MTTMYFKYIAYHTCVIDTGSNCFSLYHKEACNFLTVGRGGGAPIQNPDLNLTPCGAPKGSNMALQYGLAKVKGPNMGLAHTSPGRV
mmetsp:Transcript_25642/g.46290  ORF Transcript_25642/g.46290 Transcript_25642/m.46290 type:complete len:87 (+) Transcript_25642:3759-4019(+)